MYKQPSGDDFKYIVDYDSESSSNCEERGCSPDDYCRCSTIDNVTVNDDLSSWRSFATKLWDGPEDDMGRTLLFWFVKLNFKRIVWTWEAEGGYYGEELGSITIDSDGGFWNHLETFDQLSTTEKIHYLLVQEYGSVLPRIKEVEHWTLKAVLSRDVHNSSNKTLNSKVLKQYEDFCQSIVNQDSSRRKFQENVQYLAPLCLEPSHDGNYEIIDGRHRCTALKKTYTYFVTGKKIVMKTVNTKAGKVQRPYERPDNQNKDFTPVYMWIICPAKKEVA